MRFSTTILLCSTLTLLHPRQVLAQETAPATSEITAPAPVAEAQDDDSIAIEWTTYGAVNGRRFLEFKNAQDTSPRTRLKTDLERVVFEPELEFSSGIKIESEIEFEHGGTGVTMDYDGLDESGEFEHEVEAGGEVIIEQLMLEVPFKSWLNWRFGYITVPVGMISQRNHPNEYFTTMRNRSEDRILPNTWRDTGLTVFGDIGRSVHFEGGVFNALNSELFRKSSWIKGGQRRIFEEIYADDLALALRVDYGTYFKRSLIGASVYRGNATNNRRKVDKLTDDSNVFIWDVHAFWESPTWTARAMYLRGTLDNADKVSNANATLPKPLLAGSQAPLGSSAEAWFAEVGYNVQKLVGSSRRLDLFGRYDAVDPMKDTTGSVIRDPRFSETGWTAGVNYYFRPEIVLKAQYGEYKSGLDSIPTNQEIGFGFGWFYSTES